MVEREWSFVIGDHTVVLVAAICGLASEVELIRGAMDRCRPRAAGISVTTAQIENLRKWNASEEQPEPDYSDFDIFYMREMSRFGDVVLPSPSHLFTVAAGDATGMDVVGLDMDDDDYTDLYMANVTPVSLFFDSIFRKRRLRKHFEGSAEEVVLRLDEAGRHPEGIARIEAEREKHMAGRILECASSYGRFLAVVDYERAEGVRRRLGEQALTVT